MNIKPAQADKFLRGLDPKFRAVLLYGPNLGLVEERTRSLFKAAGADTADPFAVVELTMATLKADRTRLTDEAGAMSFSGGQRIIRIRDATDALGAIVGDWLDGKPDFGLVVVEAGDLAKSSSLRKAFESAAIAAAVPCYADGARDLAQFVREVTRENGKRLSTEAADFLALHLSPDRALSRRELEKLLLYVGAETDIGLDHVAACIEDNGASSLDALVYAACDGDMRGVDRAIERIFADGTPPVSIIRAAARHLQRLLRASALMEAGQSPEQAIGALRPPVFIMLRDRFRRQLSRWPTSRIAPALQLLTEAELACKSTGLPDAAICHRAFMKLAQAAAR
ncbi:MAG: DNA polymerase III subunit delta [Rhodospirillales bacterium]|nr:DNA polymerase III subunit delta [Rhodospirillales bacterium]